MAYQQYNPSVMRQLASNGDLFKIHARSQMCLGQIRAEAAVRSIAANDSVLAAGAMRNYPPLRIVHFADKYLCEDIETHEIEGVAVPIFGVAKTIADAFRHRRSVGIDVAISALKEALRQRKATPSEISAWATKGGVWNVLRPYLEAFTADA